MPGKKRKLSHAKVSQTATQSDAEKLKELLDLKELIESVDACKAMKADIEMRASQARGKEEKKVELDKELPTKAEEKEFFERMKHWYATKDKVTGKTKAATELEKIDQVLAHPAYFVFLGVCERMGKTTTAE